MLTLPPFPVLFTDNHLLVIEKPAGMLSQSNGTATPDVLTVAKDWIKQAYNKPGNVYLGLVQRLDRNVSGLMVLARTSKAAARLSENIRNREFKKTYTALVSGTIRNKSGSLENWIIKDNKKLIAQIVSIDYSGSQKAQLDYQVIKEFSLEKLKNLKWHSGTGLNKGSSQKVLLIQIQLHTGRFHQIRIQMASQIGPIVGDRKYGSKLQMQHNNLCLHCNQLSLIHPVKKEWLTFDSNIPASWSIPNNN